jgi:hypothetical protein
MLGRHNRTVSLGLLRQVAGAAITSGDGEAGETLLNRALLQAEAEDGPETGSLDQAREVPRGFRTVHPLGWTSGKVK